MHIEDMSKNQLSMRKIQFYQQSNPTQYIDNWPGIYSNSMKPVSLMFSID